MTGHSPAQARMSLSAPSSSGHPAFLVRYLDVVLLVVAAPIALLIGAPALGFCVGAGAWLALRAVGVPVERRADAARTATKAVTTRLGFLFARLFLLALAVILVRSQDGQDQGLATLLVIVGAYTLFMAASFADRPRRS
jgi:hypothetical protein